MLAGSLSWATATVDRCWCPGDHRGRDPVTVDAALVGLPVPRIDLVMAGPLMGLSLSKARLRGAGG